MCEADVWESLSFYCCYPSNLWLHHHSTDNDILFLSSRHTHPCLAPRLSAWPHWKHFLPLTPSQSFHPATPVTTTVPYNAICLCANVYPTAFEVLRTREQIFPTGVESVSKKGFLYTVSQIRCSVTWPWSHSHQEMALIYSNPGLELWLSWCSAWLACWKPWVPSHSCTA